MSEYNISLSVIKAVCLDLNELSPNGSYDHRDIF